VSISPAKGEQLQLHRENRVAQDRREAARQGLKAQGESYVRRHAKASSSGPNERKPSGLGSNSSSGRLRLFLLAAIAAAFFLVPAAQAAATTLNINIEGSGSGTVTGEIFGEGGTELNCSGPPPAGACASGEYEEFLIGFLTATPSPGSKFTGWTVPGFHGVEENCEEAEPSGGECSFVDTEGIGGTVTATFECAEECGPTGPTNRRTLTLTKSGTGAGTVKSKPKGIACGATCTKAEASLYENSKVALTATAATGSTFTEWTGACSGAGACEVTMNEAKSVDAAFGGTAKAIANPKTLSVSKVDNGFETGAGTVKASGLACEADCTETDVSYTGGVTEPKVKAAATVTLVETASAGSTFSGWTGCDSESEGKCIVLTSSAKSVTAEFTALPKNTLTLTKSGAGAIKSKPKGIACGNTCTSATASLPSDTTIVLTEKAATGSTFTGWTGDCSGAGETCTVSMSAAKAVTATFTAAVKPLVNPKTLTVTKAGSGYGTVKASGLACELACTSTAVSYYGGVTEPKPKAATTVTLIATSAPGSGTVAWSGCESEPEGKCVVLMSKAQSVTATFNELP
jgi:uncharacterized repeat protein (TIGR02543 family)